MLEGAREVDIVYAGLEEIMTEASSRVVTTAVQRNLDMRTAAFVNAIESLHEYYSLTGVGKWSILSIQLINFNY